MSIYVHLFDSFFKDDDCSGRDCTFVHFMYIEDLKKKEEHPPPGRDFRPKFGQIFIKII